MSRWKAAAIHLGLSAVVIGAIFLAVLALWYPPGLLPMSGVIGLIALIAMVDVSLGPLLTLVVYKTGKRSLKFDLAVIVALQLGMLGYGLHILAQNRPVFMVGTPDRLTLIRASEIEAQDLPEQGPYRKLPWMGAVWVGVRMPFDPDERAQVFSDTLAGRDLIHRPAFYFEFDAIRAELLTQARPLPDLLDQLSPDEAKRLSLDMESSQRMRYLTIHSSRGAAMLLVDQDGQLGRPIAIDPYDVRARNQRTNLSAQGRTN